MSDTSKAKALLKAASPGPWEVHQGLHGEHDYPIYGSEGSLLWTMNREIADLAALAPTLLAYAIAATEALTRVTETLESDDPQATGRRCAECGELAPAHDEQCAGAEARTALAAWPKLWERTPDAPPEG